MADDYREKLSAINWFLGSDETAMRMGMSLSDYEDILLGRADPTDNQLEYIEDRYHYYTEVRPYELLNEYIENREEYEREGITLDITELIGEPIFASNVQNRIEAGEAEALYHAINSGVHLSGNLIASRTPGEEEVFSFVFSESYESYDDFILAYWEAFRSWYDD